MKIAYKIIDMPLRGTQVKGILNGDEHSWTFQCLNREFLRLFSEGIVHSFTYFGCDMQHYEHRRFQLALTERMKKIMSTHRAGKAHRNTAPPGPRRFVMP